MSTAKKKVHYENLPLFQKVYSDIEIPTLPEVCSTSARMNQYARDVNEAYCRFAEQYKQATTVEDVYEAFLQLLYSLEHIWHSLSQPYEHPLIRANKMDVLLGVWRWLCEKYQEGYLDELMYKRVDSQARQVLALYHYKLGYSEANKYRFILKVASGRFQLDDLVAWAWEGVEYASKKFDVTRGTRFSTYARWFIRQFMDKYAAKNVHHVSIPIHKYTNYRLQEKHKNDLIEQGYNMEEAMEEAYKDGEYIADMYIFENDNTGEEQQIGVVSEKMLAENNDVEIFNSVILHLPAEILQILKMYVDEYANIDVRGYHINKFSWSDIRKIARQLNVIPIKNLSPSVWELKAARLAADIEGFGHEV